MNLKDINKKRIRITREDQKKIGVNQPIKEAIEHESGEKETHAETIDRVFTTKDQMTELLAVMLEEMSDTPSKMASLLSVIPENLRNLAEAIFNDRKTKKDKKNKNE